MSNYYVSKCCNSPTDPGHTCNYCHQKCEVTAVIDSPGGVPKDVKQYQEDIKAGVNVSGKECKACKLKITANVLHSCGKENKTEQIRESEVKLAEEGTPLAIFQKERTDAITDMFNNEYGGGLYPTTQFFCRLDQCVSKLLSEQRQSPMGVSEWMRIGKANGYHDYWKDMTRIAIMKELLEEVEKLKQPHKGHVNYHLTDGFNRGIDTVISIIKK